MAGYRKLWWLLICILAITFSVLGYFGAEVYRSAPPIPAKVVDQQGKVLMTKDSILNGQTAWQSVGGMQLGSIGAWRLSGTGLDSRLAASRADGLVGSGCTG